MKYQLITTGIVGLLLLSVQSLQAQTQMKGGYTIDPNVDSDTGVKARNFTSFSAAALALQTYGINGPVTFYVRPGSPAFVEHVAIGQITGAGTVINNVTSTITFEGGGNTLKATGTPNTPYLMHLNGAKYVRIHSLIFDLDSIGSTASKYFGLEISNGATNNEISACQFKMPTTAILSGGGPQKLGGIVFNESPTTAIESDPNNNTSYGAGSSSLTGSNTTIEGNVIKGGWSGIHFNSKAFVADSTLNPSLNRVPGVKIIGNYITNSYQYGIYLADLGSAEILRNVIDLDDNPTADGNASDKGIGIEVDYFSGNYKISQNRVQDADQYGISFKSPYHCNTFGRGLLSNNMIGGKFSSNATNGQYGLVLGTEDNLDIVYNTVNIEEGRTFLCAGTTSPAGDPTVAAFFLSNSPNGCASTSLRIYNNSFTYTGASSTVACPEDTTGDFGGLAAYFDDWSPMSEMDHNYYYSTDTYRLIQVGNTNYATVDLFQAASSYPNDVNTQPLSTHPAPDPLYLDEAQDLHISVSSPLSGIATPIGLKTPPVSIKDDIDGEVRNLETPDIGADEVGGSGRMSGTGNNAPVVKDDFKLSVFPVPFQKEFTIILNSSKAQSAQLTLTDVKGRVVHQQTVQLRSGEQQINIKPGAILAKGSYQLLIQKGSERNLTKLIKE